MAVTTYNFTQLAANSLMGGRWPYEAHYFLGDVNSIHFRAFGSQVVLYFSYSGSANPIYLSVDDGNVTTPAYNGGNKSIVLYTGLSDTWHTVSLRCIAAVGGGYLYGSAGTWLEVTSNAETPRIEPPLGAGLSSPPLFGSFPGIHTYVEDTTASSTILNSFPRLTTLAMQTAVVRFRATTTAIYTTPAISSVLFIDGKEAGSAYTGTPINAGIGRWYKLYDGLDGSQEHEYTMRIGSGNLDAIALSSNGSFGGKPNPLPPSVFFLGDSYTQVASVCDDFLGSTIYSWYNRVADRLGLTPYAYGISGRKMVDFEAGSCAGLKAALAKISHLRHKMFFINLGTNIDFSNYGNSMATWASAYKNMLETIRDLYMEPDGLIVAICPLTASQGSPTIVPETADNYWNPGQGVRKAVEQIGDPRTIWVFPQAVCETCVSNVGQGHWSIKGGYTYADALLAELAKNKNIFM